MEGGKKRYPIINGTFFMLDQNAIGKGSFCELFMGRNLSEFNHDGSHYNVAIKLQTDKSIASSVIKKEADMLRALSGLETVPQYIDHGRHEGTEYLVMELLGGEDMAKLRDRARKQCGAKHIPLPIAVYCITQMLSCLKDVHSRGLVHRDVKPANFVRKSKDSTAFCIIDFGLTRQFLDADGHLLPKRAHVEFRGTTMYASPKTLEGEEQCPRDDLYGMVLVLCDMLCGCMPWGEAARCRDKPEVARLKRYFLVEDPTRMVDYVHKRAKEEADARWLTQQKQDSSSNSSSSSSSSSSGSGSGSSSTAAPDLNSGGGSVVDIPLVTRCGVKPTQGGIKATPGNPTGRWPFGQAYDPLPEPARAALLDLLKYLGGLRYEDSKPDYEYVESRLAAMVSAFDPVLTTTTATTRAATGEVVDVSHLHYSCYGLFSWLKGASVLPARRGLVSTDEIDLHEAIRVKAGHLSACFEEALNADALEGVPESRHKASSAISLLARAPQRLMRAWQQLQAELIGMQNTSVIHVETIDIMKSMAERADYFAGNVPLSATFKAKNEPRNSMGGGGGGHHYPPDGDSGGSGGRKGNSKTANIATAITSAAADAAGLSSSVIGTSVEAADRSHHDWKEYTSVQKSLHSLLKLEKRVRRRQTSGGAAPPRRRPSISNVSLASAAASAASGVDGELLPAAKRARSGSSAPPLTR
jgi:serine/threonine protein kinase